MPYAAEGDPKTARIIFIGEAPSHVELMTGRPFTGPSGHIFNECLEQAGILRSDCFITNVFQEKIKKQRGKSTIYNDKGEILFQDGKHGFSALGMEHVKELEDQISNSEANVIVPLGGPAFRAICSQTRITKWRGSILKGVMKGVEGKKVIPTLHPANVIHGQYVMKYVITSDFRRVNRESKFPDVRRPPYRFKLRPTFAQCMEALEFMKTLNTYACDIEIGYVSEKADPMGQITRICFSWTELDAISIPYGDAGWTLDQEIEIWRETGKLLEIEGPLKIFHNGIFDIQFMLFIHNILTAPPYADTMVAHHVVYPDFPKSLAFCGSIHTDQPYWKDMVKHASIENPES